LSEYKSNISYIEPAVSYFDGLLNDAGKTCISAVAAAVGIALVAAVATSVRGSENTLERWGNV
jgi:phage antirepressor YoqD-like protein